MPSGGSGHLKPRWINSLHGENPGKLIIDNLKTVYPSFLHMWTGHHENMDTRDSKSNSSHVEDVREDGDTTREQTDQDQTAFQCLAQNPWVILFCLYGNLGALMYGFDNLVLSLALSMPGFE